MPKELVRKWAELRFAILAPLLTCPPGRGDLDVALAELAKKVYRHPIHGGPITFGASTIQRWYYRVRTADDPIAELRRQTRSDRGHLRVMSPDLLGALEAQYREHPNWSVQLHVDNLAALVQERPKLGPMPSYSTVRRRMDERGWWRKKRPPKRLSEGRKRALERLERQEVRSFEVAHVHALWHLDFHEGSRRVVDARGVWRTPKVLAILDDRSRLICHLQWYWAENAENLVHGLIQAFAKRGLPRALLTDNGGAMIAAETTGGLCLRSVQHRTTLPASPYQNGKQERFWDTLEGRLLPMLESIEHLTLGFLNRASQAWVEQGYNRKQHSETGEVPLNTALESPDLSRPCPDLEILRLGFTRREMRIQRRSDGTVQIGGVRMEVPSRLRTLKRLCIRHASWDRSRAYIVDERSDEVVAQIHPLDPRRNADGRRRHLAPVDTETSPPVDADPIPPLLRQLLADYAATGLPPAYLPKDETQ